MNMLMIPGVRYDFGGGRVYLVPPLSLGALELLQADLAALATAPMTDPASVRTMIDATHMALRRNYPELTRPAVGELIDVGNIGDVYECLMDVAGVKRRAQAEADAAGNEMAKGSPTGPGSSPPSAPEPAGPGSTSAST